MSVAVTSVNLCWPPGETVLILGWHTEYFHITAMGNVFVPVGSYNTNRNQNTGLSRWAVEPDVGSPSYTPNTGRRSQYLWAIR